ncbi:MAG TPA: TIGR01777 family oxidoreductase [Chitinophagaceae bacterium]|nr:TIGR01777 family oxidoreductase [Chitinophagaceae bacterium]
MATVLITGGTGMIGRALSAMLLERGYEVIVLTRDAGGKKRVPVANGGGNGLSYAVWDVQNQTIDAAAVQQADYIVHLAGAGVADKRWSDKRKQEIVNSRTQSSALIVKALKEHSNKVKAVVGVSGIGWYGPDPVVPNPKPFVETDPVATDFLGNTCRLWEDSIEPVTLLGKRLVKLRTGVVLSNDGGALAEFKKPLRFGLAAILGSGSQVMSWIHIDDVCRIFLQALEDEQLHGVYNAVAPQPVSNKLLTLHLAKAMRGKFYLPVYVPSFLLKIVLGGMSIEVLKSATVSARKIHCTGFDFAYPSIDAALNALTCRPDGAR